jgi:hypothetical protein
MVVFGREILHRGEIFPAKPTPIFKDPVATVSLLLLKLAPPVEVEPYLDVVRRKRDLRKGKTRKYIRKDLQFRDHLNPATLESFNGLEPKDVGIESLHVGGRWKVLDYRTSAKPFVAKVPFLCSPSYKSLKPAASNSFHYIWNNAGKTDSFSCYCGASHRAVSASRRHRKQPEYFKEKGFSQILPEFAVVKESVICEIFGVSFPSDMPEELTPESKRFLQHIIRRYEIRKAEFELTRSPQLSLSSQSLSSSLDSVGAPAVDFSALKSVEISVPGEQMWVIVFHESYEIDHGISSRCADSFQTKLCNFDIPYIRVKLSSAAYGDFVGYRGLPVFGRWGDFRDERREYKLTKRAERLDEVDFELAN